MINKKPIMGKDMYRKDEWKTSHHNKIGVFYSTTTSHSSIWLLVLSQATCIAYSDWQPTFVVIRFDTGSAWPN
jgi:hypothetical protein